MIFAKRIYRRFIKNWSGQILKIWPFLIGQIGGNIGSIKIKKEEGIIMKTTTKSTTLLTVTGLFAAMITLMTAYICHIPYGANGGYIHFGDALIYIAAAILPRPYALAAAALGGGLADLLTAPMWAPATIIIKMLITLPFTSENGKILEKRNLAAPFIAMIFTVGGYYIAEGIMFGSFYTAIASAAGNVIQGAGSAIIFFVLGAALDKAHLKVKTNQILCH